MHFIYLSMNSELSNFNINSIPTPSISWGCLTEKELRRQVAKKRQHSRRIERRKEVNSSKKLKWARKALESQFESHAGFTGLMENGYEKTAQMWKKLCMKAESNQEFLLRQGENILLLLLALKDCTSFTQFVSIIGLYVKAICPDLSFSDKVIELIQGDFAEFFGKKKNIFYPFEEVDFESDNWESQSGFFDDLLGNYRKLADSPFLKKIGDTISTLLALGFLSETQELTYTMNGMTMFRMAAARGHKTCFDLIEVILSTMKFVVERGYMCFQTNSIDPLFFDDDAAWEFQESYMRIISNFEYVKIGEWKSTNEQCPWTDERDFDLELTQVTDKCREICKSASNYDRNLMQRQLERLLKVRTDFELTRTSGGMREAPFSFSIFGASGIGKSTIVNNLITYSLQQYAWYEGDRNYVVDPNSICTLNEMDKYHSDYKSHIQAVLLDDLANAAAKTTDVNPTVNIINFINNVARTAIMAEAELKGKIQIRPKIVAATTNVRELNSRLYSNEPVSILRRFQLHITATVKPEYLKNENMSFIDGARLAQDAVDGDYCPDAWQFSVHEAYGVDQDPGRDGNPSPQSVQWASVMYKNARGEDKAAIEIGMADLLMLIRQKIRTHVHIQKSVVSSSKAIFSQKLCAHGFVPKYCTSCEDVPHVEVCKPCKQDQQTILPCTFESHAGLLPNSYREEFARFSDRRWWNWESFIPAADFASQKVQWGLTFLKSQNFIKQVLAWNFVATICGFFVSPLSFFSSLGAQITASAVALQIRKQVVIDRILASREFVPDVVKNVRDNWKEYGLKLFSFAAAVIALYHAYRVILRLRTTNMENQGNGMSVHMETENVWLQPVLEELPTCIKNFTREADLAKAVTKQLVHVEIGDRFCNGLFVGSNMLLIPGHERVSVVKQMKIRRDGPEKLSGLNFDCLINPEDCVQVADSDLCLVYVPRSGDRKDLLPFFPEKLTNHKIMTKVYRRTPEGELATDTTRIARFGNCSATNAEFHAGFVKYSEPTFGGQCMAVHLYDSSSSYIAGFHAAGITNTNQGAVTRCTRKALLDAKAVLTSRPTVVFATHSGEMCTQSYGKDFTPRPEIEKKSPLNFQENAQVAHFGTMPEGRVRPKSQVVVSPASEAVTSVTGIERKHGKPANCRKSGVDEGNPIKDWAPYQKYITGAGNAYQEFPAQTLKWAFEDYIKEIDDLCDSSFGKELLSRVRILDDVETISGVDGMRFVDAMKPTTSMGWPVNKAKKAFLTDLEPSEELYPTTMCPRAIDSETLSLAARARARWLEGQRSYEFFKTCTKDEPTKITKDKVRCFQASPVSLQVNIRKYYLTLCHFLSMASLKSECAVGINAQGRGWHELNEHLVQFGTSRIVAGDFAAYDQHMSARMTLLANKVFEHIGRRAGYSEEDLKIMRGAATEVSYPVMSLNGELIQLYGSNPSGQNLTVYTNSIVNSLYHRCVFRKIYPHYKGRFSEAVALTTYGDDVKMSVREGFDEFNHTRIQQEFEKQGITYTMAEKDAESIPFIDHEVADFLKRKSRWESQYCYIDSEGKTNKGMWIAMLDEDSIFKSLHSNLKSKTQTQEEVAVQCIEGAMREWWFYGKEIFDLRHKQMQEVVNTLGWTNYMSEAFWSSFELREAEWMEGNCVFFPDVKHSQSARKSMIPHLPSPMIW